MAGQAFKIQHLRTLGLQRLQQAGLAAAGAAADHSIVKTRGQALEIGADLRPVGLVAALQLARAKADLAQKPAHRAGALATAPAIHQRAPALGQVLRMGIQMLGDIARHQRAPILRASKGELL